MHAGMQRIAWREHRCWPLSQGTARQISPQLVYAIDFSSLAALSEEQGLALAFALAPAMCGAGACSRCPVANVRSADAPAPRGSLAWRQRGNQLRASASGGSVDAAVAHAAAAAALAGRDGAREVAILGGEDFILSQRSGVEEELFKGQVRMEKNGEMCGLVAAIEEILLGQAHPAAACGARISQDATVCWPLLPILQVLGVDADVAGIDFRQTGVRRQVRFPPALAPPLPRTLLAWPWCSLCRHFAIGGSPLPAHTAASRRCRLCAALAARIVPRRRVGQYKRVANALCLLALWGGGSGPAAHMHASLAHIPHPVQPVPAARGAGAAAALPGARVGALRAQPAGGGGRAAGACPPGHGHLGPKGAAPPPSAASGQQASRPAGSRPAASTSSETRPAQLQLPGHAAPGSLELRPAGGQQQQRTHRTLQARARHVSARGQTSRRALEAGQRVVKTDRRPLPSCRALARLSRWSCACAAWASCPCA